MYVRDHNVADKRNAKLIILSSVQSRAPTCQESWTRCIWVLLPAAVAMQWRLPVQLSWILERSPHLRSLRETGDRQV